MSIHYSVPQNLNEALKYSKAQAQNSIIHKVRVPSVDVAAITTRPGLS